jgi:hypothetical protein
LSAGSLGQLPGDAEAVRLDIRAVVIATSRPAIDLVGAGALVASLRPPVRLDIGAVVIAASRPAIDLVGAGALVTTPRPPVRLDIRRIVVLIHSGAALKFVGHVSSCWSGEPQN